MGALFQLLKIVGVVSLFSAACVAASSSEKVWVESLTGMRFIAIPKGCFQMGIGAAVMKNVDESLHEFRKNLAADESPLHEVCVDAFFLGAHEVQASEWVKVMGESAPHGRDAEPAGGVSYDDAQEFARRLTLASAGKHRFRLPTEAEWEYACKAGEKTEVLPFGDNRVDVAWYSVLSQRVLKPSAVGQLQPNAWGLYDMLGNVWEWTADAYRPDAYATHALFNPRVLQGRGDARVIRGASHRSDYIQVRCGKRAFYSANDGLSQIGLRLVRQP